MAQQRPIALAPYRPPAIRSPVRSYSPDEIRLHCLLDPDAEDWLRHNWRHWDDLADAVAELNWQFGLSLPVSDVRGLIRLRGWC